MMQNGPAEDLNLTVNATGDAHCVGRVLPRMA